MRLRVFSLLAGQTRYGVFSNLTDRVDRTACGGWYLCLHFRPWYVELYSVAKGGR